MLRTRVLEAASVRYLIVGAGNTVVGLLTIYAALWLLGLSDVLANVIGYSVGIVLSFTLNKRWSFRHRGRAAPAFVRFVLVLGVAYAANLGTVLATLGLGMDSYVAQAAGVVPYVVVGYLGSKYFAFYVPPETGAAPSREVP